MGIDPVGVDENNVHSHNRYAYANNNPYRYVDPDGRAAQALLCVNPVACVGVAVTTVAMAYYGNKAMQDTNAILQNSADKGGDGAELLRGASASSASPGGMPPDDDDKNNDAELTSNPKHHPNSVSPEPKNVNQLYRNSVRDNSGVRWAKDSEGTIHRFSRPRNGETHWNGSTSSGGPLKIKKEVIPNEIRKGFKS